MSLASVCVLLMALLGLNSLFLPSSLESRHTLSGLAAAHNFLIYRQACLDAVMNNAQLSDAGIATYLPPGYEALGDWGAVREDDVLYVFGDGNVPDTWSLTRAAGSGANVFTRRGNVLVPGGTAAPSAIPEGALVMKSLLP